MLVRDRIPLRKGLPETVLAYVAGVIEGDGSIFVMAGGQGRSGITVAISNGNLRLLDWIHTIIGGAVRDGHFQRKGSALHYHWGVHGEEAVHLCSLILPYLVGKRRQAELVIEAGQLKQGWPRRGKGHPALIRRRLQEIADECSWCNREAWRGEEPPRTKNTTIPEQAKLELVS